MVDTAPYDAAAPSARPRSAPAALRGTGFAAVASGVLALGTLVLVLAGEASQGADAFMVSTSAKVAGMAAFLSACLLVVGLLGFALRYAGHLGGAGRTALGVLAFATAVTTGSAATLALVVPYIADELPGIGANPPAVVPPAFILSGLVMGVCGIVLGVALRRAAAAPGWATGLLIAGSVLSIVPLPSRFFLLSIAIGVLVLVGRSSESD